LLLGQGGHSFECAHAYGTGDHCLSFDYTPEFIDECNVASFPIPSIPPLSELSPLTVIAALGVQSPERVSFDELATSLACTVGDMVNSHRKAAFTPGASDERRVSAALRFIEAHASESLPLRLLASTAKMSAYHFLRTFRGVTGLTPHQYILRVRLCQAAMRLANGQARILDVALASGFTDLSNFNRTFRTEFGLSPRVYRSRHSLRGGLLS
jgi:AraC-like DNA-binding protein